MSESEDAKGPWTEGDDRFTPGAGTKLSGDAGAGFDTLDLKNSEPTGVTLFTFDGNTLTVTAGGREAITGAVSGVEWTKGTPGADVVLVTDVSGSRHFDGGDNAGGVDSITFASPAPFAEWNFPEDADGHIDFTRGTVGYGENVVSFENMERVLPRVNDIVNGQYVKAFTPEGEMILEDAIEVPAPILVPDAPIEEPYIAADAPSDSLALRGVEADPAELATYFRDCHAALAARSDLSAQETELKAQLDDGALAEGLERLADAGMHAIPLAADRTATALEQTRAMVSASQDALAEAERMASRGDGYDLELA